ncbi:MAG TPA: hypothetical protein V6C65_07880 [Allocoleopsis sp.]
MQVSSQLLFRLNDLLDDKRSVRQELLALSKDAARTQSLMHQLDTLEDQIRAIKNLLNQP